MAQDIPQNPLDFSNLRMIPIDQDPSFDPSKQQSNPKDIVSSEPVQLKPSTNKTLPNAVQPLPTPKDLYNTTVEGAKQVAQTTQDIGQGPSSGSTTAEQVHDLITGAVKAGTVPMMFAAAVDPMLMGQGLLETTAAQKTGEGVARMSGASPETAEAVGDVAAVALPSSIHLTPARPEGSAFFPNPEAGKVANPFSGLRVQEDTSFNFGANAEPEIKISTDNNGIKWAESADGIRVSVPNRIPEDQIQAYAKDKIGEQATMQEGVKAKVAASKESPKTEPFEGTHYSTVQARENTLFGEDRGKAAAGSEKGRLQHDNKVPGSYVYRKGATPEPQIGTRVNKYNVSGDKAIADISGAQKDQFVDAHKEAFDKYKATGDNDTIANQKAVNDAEANLRDSGFHGYEDKSSKTGSVFLFGDTTTGEHFSNKAAELASKQGGGFSINPKTGEAPTEGYMSEAVPEIRRSLDHVATPKDIKQFHDDNKELFDKHPELHIGGWYDPDAKTNELNASLNIPDKNTAAKFAKSMDQIAMFDLKKGESVPTGGESKRQDFSNYPTSERVSDAFGKTEMGPAGFENLTKSIHDKMEPDEREFVQGSKVRQKNIVNAYRNIVPSLEETTNSMNAGAMNGGWWQRFMDTFGLVGGKDKDTGVSHIEALKQWHSAVSGNKNVADAANLAGHSYADWLEAGKPTDRKSINDIVKKNAAQPEGSGKKGNSAISDTLDKKGNVVSAGLDTTKLFRLVNSPEMKGEKPFGGRAFGGNPLQGTSPGAIKIPSMGATVAGKGNLNRLVLDAHGLDFYGMNQWNDATYIAHSVHMRQAAEALGLKGGEGQEQQWGVILGLKELLKEGLSPAEAAKGITDDFILQKGKDYAKIIKDDPESNAIFERLKSHGTKSAKSIQSGLDKIIAGRPVPREETGVNQTLLENTARRIQETISPSKIKKPKVDPSALSGLGDTPEVSTADKMHSRMQRKAAINRAATKGLE